jgi:glycosyltransferase involved in cell wall biosynthesis
MKLLFISTMHGAPWGGSEELWSAAALSATEKHSVFISTINWGEKNHPRIKLLQEKGAKVHLRTNPSFAHLLPFRIKLFRKLFQLFSGKPYQYEKIFNSNPDAIIISQGGSADLYHEPVLAKWLLNTKKPYYIVTHSFNKNEYNFINCDLTMKDLYLEATKNFFIASQQVSDIEQCIGTVLENKMAIQNPLNLSTFDQIPFPQSKVSIWATVSSLNVKWKGQDRLIKILAQEKWYDRKWMLNIYGSGPDLAFLTNLVKENNLEDKIHFKGHESDIRKLWSENQVLLISSRQDIVPLSMLEAMVCERPIVALPIGGVPEWVEHKKTGLLAKNETDEALDELLEKLWNSRNLCEQWGISARKMMEQKMDKTPELTLLNQIETSYAE